MIGNKKYFLRSLLIIMKTKKVRLFKSEQKKKIIKIYKIICELFIFGDVNNITNTQ